MWHTGEDHPDIVSVFGQALEEMFLGVAMIAGQAVLNHNLRHADNLKVSPLLAGSKTQAVEQKASVPLVTAVTGMDGKDSCHDILAAMT